MELNETVPRMLSADYTDRFVAEYDQVKIRYDKLCNMINNYKAGKLNFQPKCSIEVLSAQATHMYEYMHDLELRASIEEIDLAD